jgi:hypothetical protein
MAGLVPAIHVFLNAKTWMPGTRPGMTMEMQVNWTCSNRGGRQDAKKSESAVDRFIPGRTWQQGEGDVNDLDAIGSVVERFTIAE